jgi:hypothetical protein
MGTHPQDPLQHAGQVVRRMLLRRNIAVDPETAQLVATAVQAVLHAGTPSRPPRRGLRVPAADCEPLFLYGADIRPRACSCLTTGTRPSASYRGERGSSGSPSGRGGSRTATQDQRRRARIAVSSRGLLARYHVRSHPGPVRLLASVTQPSHR